MSRMLSPLGGLGGVLGAGLVPARRAPAVHAGQERAGALVAGEPVYLDTTSNAKLVVGGAERSLAMRHKAERQFAEAAAVLQEEANGPGKIRSPSPGRRPVPQTKQPENTGSV